MWQKFGYKNSLYFVYVSMFFYFLFFIFYFLIITPKSFNPLSLRAHPLTSHLSHCVSMNAHLVTDCHHWLSGGGAAGRHATILSPKFHSQI